MPRTLKCSERAGLRMLVCALFVVAGCGSGDSAQAAAQGAKQGTPTSTQNRGPAGGPGFGGPGGGRRPDGPVAVEVQQVRRGSLAREILLSGVLSPVRSVGVNAQLAGALLSVRAEEGTWASQGQVLAEVDSREVRAQLRSAEAALALGKSTAERSERLLKDRVVTPAEYERDQAALAAAQASVDGLRTRLGYALVRAPIAGVVTEKRVEAGDVVQNQTRLFTVADVSTLVVRVQVSELEITGLKEGQTANVTIDAFGSRRFEGRIRRIFPAADSTTRMVPVEIGLTGAAVRELKPGYLARVTMRVGERPGVLLARATARVGSREAPAVFVVRGTTVERRLVRLGQSSGDQIEILEGLREGESVVVLGADQLRDGATIRIVAPIGDTAGAR